MSSARSLGPLFAWLLALACAASGPGGPAPEPRSEPPLSREVYPGDDGRVFYPERSVNCDRATRICYSGGTPSVSATERHLGEDAARELERRESDAPPGPP